MEDNNHPDIIETFNLNFAYGRQAVLHDISLRVPAGSIFGFLGPNGAGKSTTIKTMLGLLRVKTGMIRIFGSELNTDRIQILEKTGSTIEIPSLYDHLSARTNIEITQRLRRVPVSRVDEVIEIVGLGADTERPVRQFSTGMKQRLSLALALLGRPGLLILDEPINGLDPQGIREIRNILVKLNREEGCTIFLSSHILDEIEKVCDHVAVIHLGRILYQGKTEGIRQHNSHGETLVLETNDNARCIKLFPEQLLSYSPSEITCECGSREEAAKFLRKIFEAGIDVYSARREKHRLEESFFELLKEGQQA